jgi:uncharacterized protein YbjT (DUF2867 family)
MTDLTFRPDDRVLVLGATGFIGKRLVMGLLKNKARVRLFVRSRSKAVSLFPPDSDIEIMTGDVLTGHGLRDALRDVHTAFYLVHSMGGKSLLKNMEFADKDKKAARNFVSAADHEGLKRVIYLGGLGETDSDLSEHLRSRAEVAEILAGGKAAETFLRAAVIVGAGGASFEMLRYLVERLPIMICPRWINTEIQPIAVRDVIAYLTGCLMNEKTAGRVFDICGPDVMTYREMMHQYAEARGIAKRVIVTVPVLTPQLSAYWVDLVTPIDSGIAHPLIEGMKNKVVCRDSRIDEFVPIQKTGFGEGVKIAFSEEKKGPGISGF